MEIAFELNGKKYSMDVTKLPRAQVYGITRGLRELVRDAYADETEAKHGSAEKALAARIRVADAMVARILSDDVPEPGGAARGPRNPEGSAWVDFLLRAAVMAKARTKYTREDVPKVSAGTAAIKAFASKHFDSRQVATLARMVATVTDTSGL
jgi:hypothetical protein